MVYTVEGVSLITKEGVSHVTGTVAPSDAPPLRPGRALVFASKEGQHVAFGLPASQALLIAVAYDAWVTDPARNARPEVEV